MKTLLSLSIVLLMTASGLAGCAAPDRTEGARDDTAPVGMNLGDINHRYPILKHQ